MSNPNPIVTTNIKPGTTNTRSQQYFRSSIALVNGQPTSSISRSLTYLSDYLYHNHDVISIQLETVPPNLINVVLTIGAQPVATVVRKDIEPGNNLLEKFMYDPSESLPLSKCPLMETRLEFNFDNDLTDLDSSSYYYETKENTRRVLSEEDVTIYNEDEGCCMSGKQVLGYEVDKIQIIHFVLPKITVESREACYPNSYGIRPPEFSDWRLSAPLPEDAEERTKTTAYVKIWERILITRSNFTEELLEKYIQNYELCTDDGGNIIEMYRALDDKNVFVSNVNKVVFEAKLVNQIRFGQGMAGVSQRF